jgi:phosphoribosyl-AMP cyclohydrolase / phosphoribosyl-ATP pyrophosphohydrolase
MIVQPKFDEHGLIPAIIQDSETLQVLTLAYMNAESFALTVQTGEVWLWSRSRRELWHKGATSGNTQRVIDITLDCDEDALVVRVAPRGPACHTGATSCFHNPVTDETTSRPPAPPVAATAPQANGQSGENPAITLPEVSVVQRSAMEFGIVLDDLYALIADRRKKRPEGSYTTYLFNSGLDKILKKVGEESAETIIAAKNGSRKEMSAEISDLFYHLLVLMAECDVSLGDIVQVLRARAGKPAETKK